SDSDRRPERDRLIRLSISAPPAGGHRFPAGLFVSATAAAPHSQGCARRQALTQYGSGRRDPFLSFDCSTRTRSVIHWRRKSPISSVRVPQAATVNVSSSSPARTRTV